MSLSSLPLALFPFLYDDAIEDNIAILLECRNVAHSTLARAPLPFLLPYRLYVYAE